MFLCRSGSADEPDGAGGGGSGAGDGAAALSSGALGCGQVPEAGGACYDGAADALRRRCPLALPEQLCRCFRCPLLFRWGRANWCSPSAAAVFSSVCSVKENFIVHSTWVKHLPARCCRCLLCLLGLWIPPPGWNLLARCALL